MIKKRLDKPQPYTVLMLRKGVPPGVPLRVSTAFREYADKHWQMQTLMVVATPTGCLLDKLFDGVVEVLTDPTLEGGQIVFSWEENGVEYSQGIDFLYVSGEQP